MRIGSTKPLTMKVYSYSGKGNRETNEDYIKSETLTNNVSLHIVADGMGAYQFGKIASQLATDAIFEYITENNIEDSHTLIQHAIVFANEKILSKQNQYHAKLGTSLAGILIKNSTAYAFWLGDVQIQYFRDNKQLFISESHSLINEIRNKKLVVGKDIERYKNIVTKSLSGRPFEENIAIVEIHLQKADTICISTDGLYNSTNISTLIAESDTKMDTLLKDMAQSNEDNFSIIRITI